MLLKNIEYEEPLFRPPAEAFSLIFQVTIGCSWNDCAFCEMYSTKKFRAKKEEDVLNEIQTLATVYPDTRKIFLADGNAMVLSTPRLLRILHELKKYFPRLNRVSAYALPKDIYSKTDEELKALHDAGLKLLYVGIESGDDELLKLVNKSETYQTSVEGLLKAHTAGMKISAMILTGLGGQKYSEQHAINSARLLNETQPEFTSVLVLSFPFGEKHYMKRFRGEFIHMSTLALLKELEIFIAHTELNGSIFRSNHASNYLSLEGILSRDKEKLLTLIRFALANPEKAGLRKEWQRGM